MNTSDIEKMKYRPYLPDLAVVPLGIVGVVFAAVVISGFVKDNNGTILAMAVLLSLLGISFFFSVTMIGASLITIRFISDGLLISVGKCNKRHIMWKDYPYFYSIRSFRGQNYWVLSKSIKSDTQLRKLANCAEWILLRKQTEDCVVIWENAGRNAVFMREAIEKQYSK